MTKQEHLNIVYELEKKIVILRTGLWQIVEGYPGSCPAKIATKTLKYVVEEAQEDGR